MQQDFWHERWKRDEIGFHQDSVNQYLSDHWSALGLRGDEPVLIPLCGKSLDLHWINRKGHPVIGCEINELACRRFFEEAGLTPEVSQAGTFTRYRQGTITLLCGDFFALTAEHLTDVTVAYDRAALIAFPPDMRPRYAAHLTEILAPAAQVLLVTTEYPQAEMSGPPFSVPESEVRVLFADQFNLEMVHQNELGRDDPFAKRKGLSDLWEKVYVLKRGSG